MKKRKIAFTLVELMIVIAIIGILAITLIPQLTGAQARARDTGRISSISTTRAVLETYFGDSGTFPAEQSSGCLSNEKGEVSSEDFKALFNKGRAPIDPQKQNKSMPCNIGGPLGYKVLQKGGTSGASYLIVTNVETRKKANTVFIGSTSGNDYDNYTSSVGAYTGGTLPSGTDDSKVVYAEVY